MIRNILMLLQNSPHLAQVISIIQVGEAEQTLGMIMGPVLVLVKAHLSLQAMVLEQAAVMGTVGFPMISVVAIRRLEEGEVGVKDNPDYQDYRPADLLYTDSLGYSNGTGYGTGVESGCDHGLGSDSSDGCNIDSGNGDDQGRGSGYGFHLDTSYYSGNLSSGFNNGSSEG